MEEKYLSDVEAFLRKSLSEENEAVSVYEQRSELVKMFANNIRETNPELADKFDDVAYTINDIKKEEEVHIGELTEMLKLIGVSDAKEQEGREEAEENIEETFIDIANKLKYTFSNN